VRPEKKLLLDEISDKMEGFGSFIVTRYQKLSANLAHEFRGAVVGKGGEFEVVKKRLLAKVAESKDITMDVSTLDGHIGVVFLGEDAIETTKAIYTFEKNHADTVSVIMGYIDGVLYDAQDVERLSKLPGKDEMRAQLLATFEAPMSQTLATMEALLTSVMHCLENKIQKDTE
jgi:large subunit ribosomal protein L10